MEAYPDNVKPIAQIRTMNKIELLNYIYTNQTAHGHIWLLHLLVELNMAEQPLMLLQYLSESDPQPPIQLTTLMPIPQINKSEQKKKQKKIKKMLKKIAKNREKQIKEEKANEGRANRYEYQSLLQ